MMVAAGAIESSSAGTAADVDACLLCGETVRAGEESPSRFFDVEGRRRLAHTECALRAVMGGIGHLENHAHWCMTQGDPDAGLSYRDSARLVRSWVEDHGATSDRQP